MAIDSPVVRWWLVVTNSWFSGGRYVDGSGRHEGASFSGWVWLWTRFRRFTHESVVSVAGIAERRGGRCIDQSGTCGTTSYVSFEFNSGSVLIVLMLFRRFQFELNLNLSSSNAFRIESTWFRFNPTRFWLCLVLSFVSYDFIEFVNDL